ncbi:MAG: cobalamin biosynthesis protein CobD [Lentisphaerae bacterium RIFOXYC12_FULL_60_16]|nr:MAG: cobalamin biosynthesis protein CobD [Lentisphaerae bacterium RIFOXYC12_FULL_60_16]OGV83833.1 MAG: cobalamin biosynthesis protein CobD [Lentisphaerae bacterium RIFOXYB12_FULL_60_10]
MNPLSILLLGAFLLDLLLGDPVYPLHPVRCIGRLITWLNRRLRRGPGDSVAGGIIFSLVVTILCLTAYGLIRFIAGKVHPGAPFVVDIFTAYSCIALRDLLRHAIPVMTALDRNDLTAARQAVANLVGRDVTRLDAAGVARATVESLAESFLDGFFAPVFWYVVAGLATGSAAGAVGAMLAYRIANTMDSMVGHHGDPYERFGKASARWDDALNFIPARLALLPLLVGAWGLRLDARNAWRIAGRDRLKHESPNSAHTESFAAGALGLRLGGPTWYPDGPVEKPWLGDGTDQADSGHIRTVSRLVLWAAILSITGATAGLVIAGRCQ